MWGGLHWEVVLVAVVLGLVAPPQVGGVRCGEVDCPYLTYPCLPPESSCANNKSCSPSDCCTDGGHRPFAPAYVLHTDCVLNHSLATVTVLDEGEECYEACLRDHGCEGFVSNGSQCTVVRTGGLYECSAVMLDCANCTIGKRAVPPWFTVRTECDGEEVIESLGNASLPGCIEACDRIGQKACGAVSWLPSNSSCDLLASCGTDGETDNGTSCDKGCFVVRTAVKDECIPTRDEYLTYWGPVLSIVVLGLMCSVACVVLCLGARKGGGGPRKAKVPCLYFAACLGPLLLLYLIGIDRAIRSDMLWKCPSRADPPWGVLAWEPRSIGRSTEWTGSVTVYEYGPKERCGLTSREENVWWRSNKCIAPADQKDRGLTAFPMLPMVEGNRTLTSAGEYDIVVRCTEPSSSSSAVVIEQFRTKDGSCGGDIAVASSTLAMACTKSMGSWALEVRCSSCPWLMWRHVKTVPYVLMLVNSICSMVFSSILAWVESKINEATDIIKEEEMEEEREESYGDEEEEGEEEEDGESYSKSQHPRAPDTEGAPSAQASATSSSIKKSRCRRYCMCLIDLRDSLKKQVKEKGIGLSEEMAAEPSMRDYAMRNAAPSFYFLVVKTLFLIVFYAIAAKATQDRDVSGWVRYQMLYIRLINSGLPLLLLESFRGVVGSLKLLSAQREGGRTGSGSQEMAAQIRMAQLNIVVTAVTLLLFAPSFVTHIIPMMAMFPWLVILIHLLGKFLLTWPLVYMDKTLGKDWGTLVYCHPMRAYLAAQLLGMWMKFTSSFFIVLPLQNFYNYGVLAYAGEPYWDIPLLEYRSRDMNCFFEDPFYDASSALQFLSFFF
eukprot:Sspe_Gene.74010::Locus_45326_Transcript_2_2_Confidence_0.667_Length_2648::g.74010::m.74010